MVEALGCLRRRKRRRADAQQEQEEKKRCFYSAGHVFGAIALFVGCPGGDVLFSHESVRLSEVF